MKINQNNKLYIQKIDLLYIYESYFLIPASIYEKTLKKKHFISNRKKYDFVEFTNPDEIVYLNNISWIIDYNEVKDLQTEEILLLDKELANQEKEILSKMKTMNNKEITNNLDIPFLHREIQLKRQSLRDILSYKLGNIQMNLPKEISNKKLKRKK